MADPRAYVRVREDPDAEQEPQSTPNEPERARWEYTCDPDLILATDDLDVIFIEDLMDVDQQTRRLQLISRIEERFPLPPEGLTHLVTLPQHIGGDRDFFITSTEPQPEIDAFNQNSTTARTAKLILQAVKEGVVVCSGNVLDDYHSFWEPRSGSNIRLKNFAEAQCVYHRYSELRQQHELVYDPKVIARRIKRREAKANQTVPVGNIGHLKLYELAPVMWTTSWALRRNFRGFDPYARSRLACIMGIPRLNVLMDFTYGENSMLQIQSFSKLLEQWRIKKRQKATREKFLADLRKPAANADKYAQEVNERKVKDVRRFFRFMTTMSKREAPGPIRTPGRYGAYDKWKIIAPQPPKELKHFM